MYKQYKRCDQHNRQQKNLTFAEEVTVVQKILYG